MNSIRINKPVKHAVKVNCVIGQTPKMVTSTQVVVPLRDALAAKHRRGHDHYMAKQWQAVRSITPLVAMNAFLQNDVVVAGRHGED